MRQGVLYLCDLNYYKDDIGVPARLEAVIAVSTDKELMFDATDQLEVDLLDIFIVLAKHKKSIGLSLVIGAACAVAISFLLPNRYTATAKILPPQQNQSISSSILGQLGPLAALAGKGIGGSNTSELYVAMLKSRTVEDQIVRRFELLAAYRKTRREDARKELESFTEITSSKEGLITISVEDWAPSRAAALANGYVDELYKLNQTLAVTEASQRRLFFEQQLQQEKDNLADAEVAMKQTQERTGLIQLDSQARVIIESVSRVQAQVAAKEVQLQSMGAFATSDNPEYIRREEELKALREQLTKLERDKNVERGDVQIATGNVPAAGLEYVRKLRDLKYHEAIFELLAKQFEIAKIDEAKSAAMIQVLDKAVIPERKSFPKRSFFLLVGALLGAVGAVMWCLANMIFEEARKLPGTASKFEILRKNLVFWA